MGAERIDLPVQLVEHVARGCCVLFLGSDVDMSTPEWAGPPTRAQLAAALADRHPWVAERQDLHLAAEEYLSKDPPYEHGLRSFVKEQVEAVTTPGPVHTLCWPTWASTPSSPTATMSWWSATSRQPTAASSRWWATPRWPTPVPALHRL